MTVGGIDNYNMQKTFDYLKKHWRLSALIAGGVLIVISVGSFMILANMRNKSMAKAPAAGANANTNAAVVPESAATKTYADLYAVSIDNMVDARPASGINQAAFIYEAPVEGNITRFLAFFERGVGVPQIGPVRSARLYFLDWIMDWSAPEFFHFGGSPEALAHIAATPALAAADEDGVTGAGGALYARDKTRNAPHNAYTSSDNAEKAFDRNTRGVTSVNAWLMDNDPDISARGADGQKIAPPLSSDTAYDPVWVYSSATNLYTRTVKGQVEKDAGGGGGYGEEYHRYFHRRGRDRRRRAPQGRHFGERRRDHLPQRAKRGRYLERGSRQSITAAFYRRRRLAGGAHERECLDRSGEEITVPVIL